MKWLWFTLLNICNSLDALFTYFYVFKCGMTELNPIIDFAIQDIGVWFAPLKIFSILFLSLLIIQYYDCGKFSKWALICCAFIYILVCMYHFVWLGVLFL